MRDRPTGSELLREARRLLREELAGELEGVQRFKVLMAANAMAMAMRELEAGDRPLRRELDALCALLGEPAENPSDIAAVNETLAALNRRLAREIRDGRWDGTEDAHSALLLQARDRVKESNPKALDDRL